jgi:hypothetical protein
MGPVRNMGHQSLLVILVALLVVGWSSVAAAGNDPLIFGSNGRPGFLESSITNVRNDNREISRRTEDAGLDCFESLIFSDVDYDRRVNKTEYLTFLNLYGPENFLPDSVEDFDDLPL